MTRRLMLPALILAALALAAAAYWFLSPILRPEAHKLDGPGMERTPAMIMAGDWVCETSGLTLSFAEDQAAVRKDGETLWQGTWKMADWTEILPAEGDALWEFEKLVLTDSSTLTGCRTPDGEAEVFVHTPNAPG